MTHLTEKELLFSPMVSLKTQKMPYSSWARVILWVKEGVACHLLTEMEV